MTNIELRISGRDIEDELRIRRALFADNMCAAIWDMQQELNKVVKYSESDSDRAFADSWLHRFNQILEETGADAAMDSYSWPY